MPMFMLMAHAHMHILHAHAYVYTDVYANGYVCACGRAYSFANAHVNAYVNGEREHV